MQNNKTTDNFATITKKVLSLEELDVICRQCNHLHDEEVLRIISRFFTKIAHFFKHDNHKHYHPSAS